MMCSKLTSNDKNALDDTKGLCESYLKIYEKFEIAKSEWDKEDRF